MKKILTSIVLVLISLVSFSQDRIVKKDKSEIKVKVLEITDSEIKYKKQENLNGPTYSIKKSDITVIIYANGQVETFENSPVNSNDGERAIEKPEIKKVEASKVNSSEIITDYTLIIKKFNFKGKVRTGREGFTTHTINVNEISNMPKGQTIPTIFSSVNIAVTKNITAGVGASYNGYSTSTKVGTTTISSDASSTAITLRGLYTFNELLKLPISKYTLYSGIGLTYAMANVKVTSSTPGITSTSNKSNSSNFGIGGIIGARASIVKSIGLIAELGFAEGGTSFNVGLSFSTRNLILKGLKKMNQ